MRVFEGIYKGKTFYHSKRAHFRIGDEFKKRQRISLMGIVEDYHQTGLDVFFLKVRTPEDVYETVSAESIVWIQSKDDAFTACGLRDGPVRAFNPIPETVWKGFLADVAERIEEYTGEYHDY